MDSHGRSELISLAAIDAGDLEDSLARLYLWLDGQRAHRQKQIVTYLVGEDLAGRAHLIKAYSLALDVFAKAEDFDPSRSSLVRVEMHRLRDSLNRYASEGAGDAAYVMALPPGQYQLMARLNDRPDQSKSAVDGSGPPERKADETPGVGDAPSGQEAGTDRPNRFTRLSRKGRRFLALAIVAVVALSLALWRFQLIPIFKPQVSQMSPTVSIEFEPADRNGARLSEIKEIIRSLNPIRFPIVINLEAESDYVVQLATTLGASGETKISAALYDEERNLIATETYPLNDFTNVEARFKTGERINERFLTIDGHVSADFPTNASFPQARRDIYQCYKTVILWNTGKSESVPDFDKALRCMNPEKIQEPRDKVLLHALRASVIANSVNGSLKTKEVFVLDDARAELITAESRYPDMNLILAQLIVLEWRDPDRDDNRLRALLQRAERGVMSIELRYNVANSYAYFLGDWDSARRVKNEYLAEQQGLSPTMGPLYYYIEIPEPFVKGDYATAEAKLLATRALSNPTYSLFRLAIACARRDPVGLADAKILIGKSPVQTLPTMLDYARGRNYAPAVENALVSALSQGDCRKLTMPASQAPAATAA